MIVRDKSIAYNEHKPEMNKLQPFWDDFSFLQDIAKLYKTTIGQVFLVVNYSPLLKLGKDKADFVVLMQLDWVLELLDEVLGKGMARTWWVNSSE